MGSKSCFVLAFPAMMRASKQRKDKSVLDSALKATIQQAYSAFLQARELRPRPAQKQMIAQIARTVGAIETDEQGVRTSENPVCLVEAGTGTGKTIAYLLSTIPLAQAADRKLVLSTATVALQQQLVNKDLPEVIKYTGLKADFRLAKGRGRYLCINKIEQVLEQDQQSSQMALYEDELEALPDAQALKVYRELLEQYASGRWNGDRDELADEVDDEHWMRLTSDHMQCSNRRCVNFSSCPFYRDRERLDEADIIVANHDLVLADLALGGGAILPEPGKTLYVFDEGHHLADKASGHFAFAMRLKSTQKMIHGLPRRLQSLLCDCAGAPLLADIVGRMDIPLHETETSLEQVELLVRPMVEQKETPGNVRFAGGCVPEALQIACRDLCQSAERVGNKIEQMVALIKDAMEGDIAEIDKEVAQRWYPMLGQLWGRVQQVSWLARSYATPDPEGHSPTARWLRPIELNGDIDVRSAPVSAAETLQEHLWSVCYGAVITSATLTALGRFDQLFGQLGLPQSTAALALQSPFDHYNCGVLQVPQLSADPSDQEGHTEAVADYLKTQLPQMSAVLVLFSSWRQLLAVLDRQDESIKNRILAQGQYSRQEILRRHREEVDAGKPSVIFGLASFAEGVDLPGDYLTEVIITKLPFSVPDDPVDATMAEWIEARGGNAFTDWTVPATSMRLTQAVGRLLRTEKDRGRIVLLDRRVVTRRYGRQLLDALPPFRREISN